MYFEKIDNNSGIENVFVSFEQTDVIQITIITFKYNRFSR